MTGSKYLRYLAGGTALALSGSFAALAANFDVPGGDLDSALQAYIAQSGVQLMVPNADVRGIHTAGAKGNLSDSEALGRILKGTGFVAKSDSSGALGLVRQSHGALNEMPIQFAQAAPLGKTTMETVTVTSSKLGGADVQSIPISITALSQEQLTATQTAGGPDLIKQVPNMTFSKTNFTGYNIQIRGIGTQAISVTTDPAVAVAFNDIPFIRNHFFEQEFYDVSNVEVLRGPQGTLYGRNATAGVVNLTSAKPSDQFEAMASADFGTYQNRRFEGMINLPIVDDRLDIRAAGEWTKRDGYSFNTLTAAPTDGRDLWSGRLSISVKPIEDLQTTLVWEHFSEDDDRMRTAKQLCKSQPFPTELDGTPIPAPNVGGGTGEAFDPTLHLSQSCEPVSLYSPQAFGVPNGYSLPIYMAGVVQPILNAAVDPYANTVQSHDLRVIESTLNPIYKAKNDVVELNTDYKLSPSLTLTSQTGFNHDFLWSTEDYNRFNTSPGQFLYLPSFQHPGSILPDGEFCDPQLGCSDRFVGQDLSDEHAWQLNQELRIASNFEGPLNFSAGGNYLHYETEENYYVFLNVLSALAAATPNYGGGSGHNFDQVPPYVPGVSDNRQCFLGGFLPGAFSNYFPAPSQDGGLPGFNCAYIDPNPLQSLNNQGHNYFLSQNPYTLNSYAAFGEAYYNVTSELKLTAGLRWTDDQKHFVNIPSELLANGWGYPSTGTVNQRWGELTGRAAANWSPKLDFTDQTLIYGSYSHGYKAGGANPPGARLGFGSSFGRDVGNVDFSAVPTHPLTFKPEFIDAFELGTKNALLDGALTLNGSLFYYNYENYQISQIVDRTSVNLNFDAHVNGAEIEAAYEPTPGLRFNFAGGWEHTQLAKGSQAIDLMDRTAGVSQWSVYKPFATQSSNCILPNYVILALYNAGGGGSDVSAEDQPSLACEHAYGIGVDPITLLPYVPNPVVVANGPLPAGYPGFDPISVDPTAPANVNNGLGLPPNSGEGFAKNLGGNELPNAPPLTISIGAQYTIPLSADWAGTLRGDYYWQDYSWARVFNDDPYDRIRGYTTVNLALILTNQSGWQAMAYVKNVFDVTAITGDFLNSDDSGLTTNVFLTDPRLIGVRITKNW
jgi:outer membrane receptor protein involved in Fe transport